ncbi:hypothetical protein ONS95_000780 [Cadophora gregata]|uniref:uncharacterized protein n=1 Tax=Cadophora gregata TaxID=51156 RepID=UPI0026DC1D0E|nr:uncharacterized protein ONS95_000780 [Cadophora gregata]KAK0128831.1 hypothetical protein ONS95_000780 [Cadophora gregata]
MDVFVVVGFGFGFGFGLEDKRVSEVFGWLVGLEVSWRDWGSDKRFRELDWWRPWRERTLTYFFLMIYFLLDVTSGVAIGPAAKYLERWKTYPTILYRVVDGNLWFLGEEETEPYFRCKASLTLSKVQNEPEQSSPKPSLLFQIAGCFR